MKSEQKELIKSETPCKECSFCEYVDNIQVGCSVNRLEKFKDLNQISRIDSSEGKTYNVIDRFCNYFRSKEWKEQKKGQDLPAEARKESDCSFGLIIDCNDHTIEKIKTTKDSVIDIDYDKEKITVVLHIDGSKDIMDLVLLADEFKKIFTSVLLVSNTQNNKQIKDRDIFQKCVNRSHFTTAKIGAVIPSGLFSSVNRCLNEELAKIVYFQSDETQTLTTKLVRSNYLNYLNYEKMCNDLKEKSQEANMYGFYEEKK